MVKDVLGASGQNYLKVIFSLSETMETVTATRVAERLCISPAAVVKMAAKLQDMNLIRYNRKKGFRLTGAGRKIALEVIRHHRLLELYLKEALGFTWDRVHEEAERMEHVISEDFEDKIDVLLKHPSYDPHGDPIPAKDGTLPEVRYVPLSELEEGQCGEIGRVSDRDPEMLRYLGELEMYPGTMVVLVKREPFGGPIRIQLGKKEHAVGLELARSVFIKTGP